MSLVAESPLHSSSSSDDFAAFLDSELEVVSSDTSPLDENDIGDGDDDPHEHRNKRHRVDAFEVTESHEGSMIVRTSQENTVTSLQSLNGTKCPPHPVSFGGLCGICGELVEEDVSGVALRYINKDLRLTSSEIDRLRRADLKDLLRKRKLILILDLDHTLLNSVLFAELTAEEKDKYLSVPVDLLWDDPKRSIFKLDAMHLLTKLRPSVRTFLGEVSAMFEMYVYTMGKRPYALEMAKLLDPKKVYFTSKVISYDDSLEEHQKGLDVILGAESIIVILDDTHRVWERHKENLILMKRYHFFTASYCKFHMNAKSARELKDNESDGALVTILEVLKHAHRAFFDTDLNTDISSRDVRQVLKEIRQEIFRGCKVVFSRVLPSRLRGAELPIWEMAQQLGAICSRQVDSSVTHVVSMDKDTEEACWALQNNKFLVNPDWIEEAYYSWHRQQEEDFQIDC